MDQNLSMIVILSALSILPFALVMMTSFAKIAVVLSILRNALGVPNIPPTMVITGMALVLTCLVMFPVGMAMKQEAMPVLETMNDETLSAKQLVSVASEGFNRSKEPLRHFLIRHANNSEKALFVDISKQLHQELADEITPNDFSVLVPAFVITELKEAFSIGFLVFVPFLLIDIIIGNILLSLGMHMMSPTVVSLPFKLLLFVMVNGWELLAKGLLLGYV